MRKLGYLGILLFRDKPENGGMSLKDRGKGKSICWAELGIAYFVVCYLWTEKDPESSHKVNSKARI